MDVSVSGFLMSLTNGGKFKAKPSDFAKVYTSYARVRLCKESGGAIWGNWLPEASSACQVGFTNNSIAMGSIISITQSIECSPGDFVIRCDHG